MNSVNFESIFNRAPTTVASAPGRVNIIGEHTDYNGGLVLPTAIPQHTHVALSRRSDDTVRAITLGTVSGLKRDEQSYQLGREEKRNGWIDYVQGATERLSATGIRLCGMDILIYSDLPSGSGLSSSAALSVALLRAFNQEFDLEMNPLTMAKMCQSIENHFVGAQVGIMDPMAVSFAKTGEALFLDTKTMDYHLIALPLDQMELVVIDSGESHSNVHGSYNTRRQECTEAAGLLGVELLSDASPSELNTLPELLQRRARHVLKENERVKATVTALETRDMKSLGKLLHESHASMRDDFQVSIPEIDLLVKIAEENPHVFGARLTGGGFGGSIVAVCQATTGAAVAEDIANRYRELAGKSVRVLLPVSSHTP